MFSHLKQIRIKKNSCFSFASKIKIPTNFARSQSPHISPFLFKQSAETCDSNSTEKNGIFFFVHGIRWAFSKSKTTHLQNCIIIASMLSAKISCLFGFRTKFGEICLNVKYASNFVVRKGKPIGTWSGRTGAGGYYIGVSVEIDLK